MKNIIKTLTLIAISMMNSCAQDMDYVVTIKTDQGDMIAILYDETPKHKENFIKLVKDHYYDSLLFHRVIKNFMIQGGDPNSKKATPNQPLGTGGPGYTIEAEIHPNLFHEKGALSAARLGDNQNPTKASSGSQFYIVQGNVIAEKDTNQLKLNTFKLYESLGRFLQKPENKPLSDSLQQLYKTGNMKAYNDSIGALIPRIEKEMNVKLTRDISKAKIKAYTTVGGTPHLDGEYTVFGKIIQGLEVIDKIANVQTNNADRPVNDIRFDISVEKLPKKKITARYHYTYPDKK